MSTSADIGLMSDTWDFSYGEPFDSEVIEKILKELGEGYIAGLSLLGGEPLEPQNQEALYPFIRPRGDPSLRSVWRRCGLSS